MVMAAGMGTRYGSLKQLEKFGPNDETIIDYSIYDAIKAGFGQVVFVIREAIAAEFKETLLPRFAGKIDVDYVLQELDILPEGYSVPENRVKPWGTGHAVWVAAAKVTTPFAVINGDDFYGYTSFKAMADYLKQDTSGQLAMVGFKLSNTLSEHGAVARGICEVDAAGNLVRITEQTHIEQTPGGIISKTPDNQEIKLTGDEVVSMNLMGFPPTVFRYLETYFREFLETQTHNPKAEFFLPAAVDKLVQNGIARVKVLPTNEKWFGVTYPADKPIAEQTLRKLIAQGVYPENLWNESLELRK
ncbi:nucleotidyltransferase [Adhaeribacter aerolatus]|uniref:Nucleotidyltransferase n=2 Tax=Adhaeribacter aerolatus TaxID=670289 RepID=A0A512AXV8_9BACT|nr:nucleotidyltransferase [Adhaeribacter aerolatus]